MADYTVVNPEVYGTPNSGVAPTANAATATDRFAATRGRKYLMRIANAGASPDNVVVDDPNSSGVVGATAAQNPDLTIPVTNGTQKTMLIDASRFADSSGFVNMTHSFVTSVTVEVYGPL